MGYVSEHSLPAEFWRVNFMNETANILKDEKLKNDLKAVLNYAVKNFEINQCFWAVRNLEGQYGSLPVELKKVFDEEIRPLLLQNKWVAITRIKNLEVLDLLEYQLLVVRNWDREFYSLTREIKNHLMGIFDYAERDQFKLKARQALLANKEVLDPAVKVKTIGDWLRDIIAVVGLNLTDLVKENEYYINNKNFKSLSQNNQLFLKDVIGVYKYCLYSSQTPEGLEEPILVTENGQLKVIEHGLIMDVPPLDKETEKIVDEFIGAEEETARPKKVPPLALKDDLLKNYRQTVNELFSSQKVKDYLQAFQKAKADEIIQKLENAANQKELDLVLAAIASLITKGQFAFLEQSQVYKEWQAGFLKSHQGLEVINLTNKEQKEILLFQFLKSLLLEKAGFDEQQGAMAGLHLANLLKEQGQKNYLNMVFADLKSQTFYWREVEIKNGRLGLR